MLLISRLGYAQHSFVKSIIPDNVGIQYAGSIGYLSINAGYDLLHQKTNLNFNYGYVPKSKGGELHIAVIKFEYKPFSIRIKNKLLIHPINPSVFLSYTFGNNFDFNFDTRQYPKGYYWWSTALREHLGISSEIKILNNPARRISSVSLYIEANTNDLYLVSWFTNRSYIPIYEIFKLGYGMKINF